MTRCKDEEGQELVCPTYPPSDLGFTLDGQWQFVMPPPIAELRTDMSEEELAEQRTRVEDAVMSLGVSGAAEEQPLCTLMRYIKQNEALLPDHVAFLVIADEEDTNSVEGCLKGFEYEHRASSKSRRIYGCSDCDIYRHTMSRVVSDNSLEFTCATADDLGNLAPQEEWKDKRIGLPTTDDCEGAALRECTQNERSRALDECGLGDEIIECMHRCSEGSRTTSCSLSSTDASLDFCSQPFEHPKRDLTTFLATAIATGRKIGGRAIARGTTSRQMARAISLGSATCATWFRLGPPAPWSGSFIRTQRVSSAPITI